MHNVKETRLHFIRGCSSFKFIINRLSIGLFSVGVNGERVLHAAMNISGLIGRKENGRHLLFGEGQLLRVN